MNMERLTGAYTLSRLSLAPSQLLLDPSNPRLITESSQGRHYTPDEICSVETQRHILDLVCRKEHDVKRLITSIREMGFVGGLHEVIVKEISIGGRYLVIEGNRRTAAIKHLLGIKSSLHAEVRRSIEQIEVKLFRYRESSGYDEQTVIDALLGSIHIDGPKEWGALERANYVSRSYTRVIGKNRPFRFDTAAAREVGATFKMSTKNVHKNLTICRVYEQLRRAEVGVQPKHYSLIDLATKTRAVAVPFFELDPETCELSQVGIERFVELILRPESPIRNPKLFEAFVFVYMHGSPLELEEIISGGKSLERVREAISRRRERREFRDSLEILKESINAIYVGDFRGTEGEKALIRRIQELVEKRLVPLLRVTERQ